jgi:ABC-type Fe3+/spermidine/putrescine transport system ATPase subunit
MLNVRLDDRAKQLKPNQAVKILIRPDAAAIEPNPFAQPSDASAEWFAETPQANTLDGTLIDSSFRGRYNRIVVRINDIELAFEIEARSELPKIGERIRLTLADNAIIVL